MYQSDMQTYYKLTIVSRRAWMEFDSSVLRDTLMMQGPREHTGCRSDIYLYTDRTLTDEPL